MILRHSLQFELAAQSFMKKTRPGHFTSCHLRFLLVQLSLNLFGTVFFCLIFLNFQLNLIVAFERSKFCRRIKFHLNQLKFVETHITAAHISGT